MSKFRVFKKSKDGDLYIESSFLNDNGEIEEKSTVLLTSDEYISYLRLTREIKDGDKKNTILENYLLTDSITGTYTELEDDNKELFGVSDDHLTDLKTDLYSNTLRHDYIINMLDKLLIKNHFVKLYADHISSTTFTITDEEGNEKECSNMFLMEGGETYYTEFNKKLSITDLQDLIENYSSNIRTSLLPDIKNNFSSDVLKETNKLFVKTSENK